MIIRDLEHYEIGSQVNQIEKVKGGEAVALLLFDALAAGANISLVQADVDLLASNVGGVSLSGISVTAAAAAG